MCRPERRHGRLNKTANRLLAGVVVLGVIARGSAQSADIPPPPFNAGAAIPWTRLYLGVSVPAATDVAELSCPSTCDNSTFTGGGYVDYGSPYDRPRRS